MLLRLFYTIFTQKKFFQQEKKLPFHAFYHWKKIIRPACHPSIRKTFMNKHSYKLTHTVNIGEYLRKNFYNDFK